MQQDSTNQISYSSIASVPTPNPATSVSKKSKAGLLILIIILSVVAVTGIIFSGIELMKNRALLAGSNAQSSDSLKFSNYHIENYKDQPYYIIDKDYEGDYNLQILDLTDDDGLSSAKIAVYEEELNFAKVLDYESYSEFCKKYNLEQKYKDTSENYAVFAYLAIGPAFLDADDVRLAQIEQTNQSVTFYIWDEASGVTASVFAYVLVAPVPLGVRNLDIVGLYTQEEFDSLKSCGYVGCSPSGELPSLDKPIIYLYPEQEAEVSIRLGSPEKLSASYPKYPKTGWRVLAKPSGDLLDLDTGLELYSLYWEGKDVAKSVTDEGFVIKGEESATFLEEKLAILGLNAREREEFIIYWLPKLEKSPYNYIRFASRAEIDDYMSLDISPTPDSVIRVQMIFKGLKEPIEVSEQTLETPIRSGFTVVEWGGTEL